MTLFVSEVWMNLRKNTLDFISSPDYHVNIIHPFTVEYTVRNMHVAMLNYSYNLKESTVLNGTDVLVTNRSTKVAYPLVLRGSNISLVYDNAKLLHRLIGKVIEYISHCYPERKFKAGNRIYIGTREINEIVHLVIGSNGGVSLIITKLDGTCVDKSNLVPLLEMDLKSIPDEFLMFLDEHLEVKSNNLTEHKLDELQMRSSIHDLEYEGDQHE